ncbi:MAG: DUF4215 domain-containing protein [Myxococcota bacterium]
MGRPYIDGAERPGPSSVCARICQVAHGRLLRLACAVLISWPGLASAAPVIVEAGWSQTRHVRVPSAWGVTADGSGNPVYVMSGSRGYRLQPDGTPVELSGLRSARGLMVDPQDGDVFVASYYGGRVRRLLPAGSYESWLWDFNDLDDVSARALAAVPLGYSGPHVSPGEALLLDRGGSDRPHRLWRFSLATKRSEVLLWSGGGSLQDPIDLAIGLDGIFLVDDGPTSGALFRLEATGTLTQIATSEPLDAPRGIAVDASSGTLLVLDQGGDRVVRIDPQSGAVSEVFAGFAFSQGTSFGNGLQGLDVSADGTRIFVSDAAEEAVYTFCKGSCSLTPVCQNGILEPGEDCDDGDIVDNSCPRDCQVPSVQPLAETVPPFEFPRDFGFYIQDLDHAVVSDGTLVFFWREPLGGGGDALVTHWWSPEGVPLTDPLMIGEVNATGPLLSLSDGHGGVLALWREFRKKVGWVSVGRAIDGAGRIRRDAPAVLLNDPSSNRPSSAARLPWGTLIVSSSSRTAQRLGPMGFSLAPPFAFADTSSFLRSATAAGLPDGGFAIAWRLYRPAEGEPWSWLRLFAADETPMGPAVPFAPDFRVETLARSPRGELVAAGTADLPWGREIWLQRLTLDGTAIGEPLRVESVQEFSGEVDVGFDSAGDILVSWGEVFFNLPLLAARVFSHDGTPMGPTQAIWDAGPGPRIQHVRSSGLGPEMHGGRAFLTSWQYSIRGFGEMLSVCDEALPSCGNGVLDHICEQCDDGAANDDTSPDACRTTCTEPRCGDGVLDSGELCDDGNIESCDGCSEDCQIEIGGLCGDGILNAACGETCDDGNGLAGDGCSPSCRLERIVGKERADACIMEFLVDNPTNLPYFDKRGSISSYQVCVDNDPLCDFDGGQFGSCTFHVRACVNNRNVTTCAPGRYDQLEIRVPKSTSVSRRPHLGRLYNALSANLVPMLGTTETDRCSAVIDVEVPLRGKSPKYRKGKGRIKVYSASGDRRDRDTLKLLCLPAGMPAERVSFGQLWGRVLSQGCATCHNPHEPCCDFLDFTTAGTAFNTLSGVGRGECAGEVRVVPGSPEVSLLYKKVTQNDVCASRMPARMVFPDGFADCRSGGCLAPDDVELIRRWIAGGATMQ